jgi:hypothetical protein
MRKCPPGRMASRLIQNYFIHYAPHGAFSMSRLAVHKMPQLRDSGFGDKAITLQGTVRYLCGVGLVIQPTERLAGHVT